MIPSARRVWVAALVVMILAAVTTVPHRHLWEPDEPRYCQSAREMIESSDWILPRLHGELYGHKPPLFMWLIAIGRLAGLGWTAAGVLPSFLPFLALLLLLPRMARDFRLPQAAGELAAGFLAASALAAIMALGARMDTLLALLFTLTLWLAARLLWPSSATGRRDHLALWLVLALAILTKGPVAVALLLCTVAVTWVATRPRPPLVALFAGPGPALALALVAAWYVPAALRGGPSWVAETLVRQSADRIIGSFAHAKPVWYHLATYPLTGLPISVAVLLLTVAVLRARRNEPLTLLAAAIAAVLGFFSLVSGKLVVYQLPLFPAAALLTASAVLREDRHLRPGLFAGALGMLVVGVGVALSPHFRGELLPVQGLLLAAGGSIAACALAALVGLLRRQPPGFVASRLTVAGLLLPAAVIPIGVQALNPTMSLAAVADTVARMEPTAQDGFVFRMNVSGPSLYTGRIFRKLRTPEELAETLRAGRVVVIEEKIWRRVRPELAALEVRKTIFQFRTGAVFLLSVPGGRGEGEGGPALPLPTRGPLPAPRIGP